MIGKPIQKITKADIGSLVSNKAAECRTMDYKLSLPGPKDDDKKEFLADVSSLANASGGDLVFGVSEVGGVADAIPGLGPIDLDGEILRLESLMRDAIALRLPGVQTQVVDGFPGGPVLIVRVPRSWASPHMVTFKNSSRFFARNNAGKYQLDAAELRSAFAASESLGERVQRFRMDRVAKVVAGETPAPMPATSKVILHILPFSSFTLSSNIGGRVLQTLLSQMQPLGDGSFSYRHNLEGFLTYVGAARGQGLADSYCQFFRTGAVEAVCADIVYEQGDRKILPSTNYEQQLVRRVDMYLKGLLDVQIPVPLLITVSMAGFRGVEMAAGARVFRSQPLSFDRDVLLLPDVLVEEYGAIVPTILRPILDAAWNAAGYEGSPNFDKEGVWRLR